MVNGEYAPDFNWYLTMGMIVVFAAFSLAGTVISANKSYKKDLKAAKAQVNIMLAIEKLAKEHKMDPSVAKKIIQIAPDIVKNMSKDSRVYFDMIMDGQVSVEDEKFLDIATSIMVGHLESHPEDMERIMTTFYEKSIPQEVLAMRMQREKR